MSRTYYQKKQFDYINKQDFCDVKVSLMFALTAAFGPYSRKIDTF